MIRLSNLGFSPSNSASENYKIFQSAADKGGDIYIDEPGIYDIDDTIVLKDNTSIIFCSGASIRRQKNSGETSYVFINNGAYTREYNSNIKILNMTLICNDIVSDDITLDSKKGVPGLNAHLAFSYIKNLYIDNFQVYDLPAKDFAIQVCSFENFVVENSRIEGKKDGVHLGVGNKFVIRHCIFKTYDDPIALNAHDYATSNPQVGWIENGVIEDCYDLDDDNGTVGFFCRILAGSWLKWKKGMEVQHSDIVEYNNRLYRVFMQPDGSKFKTLTPPSHEHGLAVYDNITWCMAQNEVMENCGCRNIHFKNIFLQKKRPVAFSIHFDKDRFSRSYYPGSNPPVQDNIIFENIFIQNEIDTFLHTRTPVGNIKLINSELNGAGFIFESIETEGIEYAPTKIVLNGVTFMDDIKVLASADDDFDITLSINGSIYSDTFRPKISGNVKIKDSDIPYEIMS